MPFFLRPTESNALAAPIVNHRHPQAARRPDLNPDPGGLLALSVLVVVLLRWVNPPTFAVMLQQGIAAHFQPSVKPLDVHHRWVDWDRIPPSVALAVIAAEDQRFPQHHGFDLVELRHAWSTFQDGGRLRGASTISQQTAKNLFL